MTRFALLTATTALALTITQSIRAQEPDLAHAALAAVRSVVGAAPARSFAVVPDSNGNAEISMFIASALPASMRTPQEARSCRGYVPQCNWKTGANRNVRVQPVRVFGDTAVFKVELWGMLNATGLPGGEQSFYQRFRVTVCRSGGTWRVLRSTIEFET